MNSADRARTERRCARVEVGLRRIGGDGLVDDARLEAEWYASRYFYWDGSGTEPLVRMRARLDIMSLRLERARGAEGNRARAVLHDHDRRGF